jgi:salicylate hydroxylase
MLPHLGAGAGQGLEDVYALCRLLSHPTTTKSNLDVLYNYNSCVNSLLINIISGRDKGL